MNHSVADTWNSRGTALNDLDQYERALTDFEKAIALNPNDPADHANNGRSFAAMQRYDEALAAYDKALSLILRLAEV